MRLNARNIPLLILLGQSWAFSVSVRAVQNTGRASIQSRPTMCASLSAPLSMLRYFCGEVATGYGRGGKKLGVPTANLPESLFAKALADVPTGVYSAWCVLEPETELPADVIPAVVNVGYSPTFVGAENPEKIAEAHLLRWSGGDFYGRRLKMLLVGFQRPERKFDSFPELLAAIRKDVDEANRALDEDPALASLVTHPLLDRPWPAAACSDWATSG